MMNFLSSEGLLSCLRECCSVFLELGKLKDYGLEA